MAASGDDSGHHGMGSTQDTFSGTSETSKHADSKHGSTGSKETTGGLSSSWLCEAADMETRLRQHFLELVEPTVRKHSVLEGKLQELRAVVQSRGEEMKELRKVKDEAEDLYRMVEGFRNEMSEWDKERRTHQQMSGDRLSLQETELHSVRRTLERKNAESTSINRTLVGLGDSLTAAREETTQLRAYAVDRLDFNRDQGAKLRDEFEQRMTTVENLMHQVQDSQTSIETIINHTSGTVAAMGKSVRTADESIADIWRSKASVGNLEAQQADLAEFMRHVNATVSSLKLQFGSLVQDVKSHFQEAADVVGTTTAIQMDAMRSQYKEELHRVDIVQSDIKLFVNKTEDHQQDMMDKVTQIRNSANTGIDSLQKSHEEQEKKRKVGEDKFFVELAQLRKHITDMKDSVHHQENMSGLRSDIMEMLVESQLLSAMLDLQDDNDRKNIALFGYKGAPTTGGTEKIEKVSALPDVHSQRSPGGSMSARGSPRKRPGGTSLTSESAPAGQAGIGQVMSLDKRCLSCSGSHDTVLAGFKMACLSYAPSQVEIGKASYSRTALIAQRVDMLEHAKAQLKARAIE